MPENLPGYDRDALNWLETRIASWAADPDLIGLDAPFVATLEAQITATQAALSNARILRESSKLATFSFKENAKEMREIGAQAVASIKSFAERAENPDDVYTAANVMPKGARSQAAPPARPSVNRASLNGDGSVTIHFSGNGGSGTTWHVFRKLVGESKFTFVGIGDPATKSFTDRSIPTGQSSAAYQVQGVRGSLQGPQSYAFTIAFGSSGGAGFSEGTTNKAA